MANKKVDLKQTGPAARSSARSVGADEFKQALMKYASRAVKGSQGCALITIALSNKQTIEAIAGADALAKLMCSARGAILHAAKNSSLLCGLDSRKVLLVDPELDATALAGLVEEIKNQLATVMLVGHQLKPIFQVSQAVDTKGDLTALLESADCEIDEHGNLIESERRSWTKNLGSKQTWYHSSTNPG